MRRLFQDPEVVQCQVGIEELKQRIARYETTVSALKDTVSRLEPARIVEMEAKISQLWNLLYATTPISKKPTLTATGQAIKRKLA